jgi:type III restriction enzyme
MPLAVENPIINSSFEKPTHYWGYKEGHRILSEGRRPVGYYLRPRTRGPQLSMFEEEFVPLKTWVSGLHSSRDILKLFE